MRSLMLPLHYNFEFQVLDRWLLSICHSLFLNMAQKDFHKPSKKRIVLENFLICRALIVLKVLLLFFDLTYNETQLTKTLEKLIQTTNLLHEQLSNEDSLPVKIPYSKDTISSMIERDFLFMKERFTICLLYTSDAADE